MSAAWACSAVIVAVLAGCGSDAPELSSSCTLGAGTVSRALARAPAPVRLEDGTPLSQCVQAATETAQLQTIGSIFTEAGAALARRAPHDRTAALRLGYLVGAAERGAAHTAGFQDELTFRMRTFIASPAIRGPERAALAAGRRAGRRAG